MRLLLVIALLASFAPAQTAVVIQLEKCDADKAKQLFEAKQKADKEWDDFRAKLGRVHDLPNFDFSKDFRFIVPAQAPSISGCCGAGQFCYGTSLNCYNGGSIVLTPSSGATFEAK